MELVKTILRREGINIFRKGETNWSIRLKGEGIGRKKVNKETKFTN